MVRSGAAPLIVYAFRRVRRSRSTEDATCEAPVHGEALEALNLMGKLRYYRHSGERARQKHQETRSRHASPCDAGRAGTYLRSEPAHRTCPSGRADADPAGARPYPFYDETCEICATLSLPFPRGFQSRLSGKISCAE